jgi:[CysO sulfur-carrier protein]-S-L-cysteine hydrolase
MTLRLTPEVWLDILGHLDNGQPNEACGLLIGEPGTDFAEAFYRCGNTEEHPGALYTLDPMDHMRGDQAAQAAGLEVIGVVHSHLGWYAYPSTIDVRGCVDKTWHYAIVSFGDADPVIRSFTIDGVRVYEEEIGLQLEVVPT